MKKLLLFVFGFFTCVAMSQDFKLPSEVLKIMDASPFSYSINNLDKKIKSKSNAGDVINTTYYLCQTDHGPVVKTYSLSDEENSIFDKAESFFSDKQYDSALVCYNKLIALSPSISTFHTYAAQVYSLKRDYKNSETEYKKAVEVNPFDYMAHWFLADLYYDMDEKSDALEEITYAIMYNRNHPSIAKSFTKIFKAAKHESDLWNFTPQYELMKTGVNQVNVYMHKDWIGYAAAKAMWEYEPNYKANFRKKYNKSVEETEFFEEKECLIDQLLTLKNADNDFKDDVQLRVLSEAANEDKFEMFFLFECLLPSNPHLIYAQSEKVHKMLKDYILDIRNPKL